MTSLRACLNSVFAISVPFLVSGCANQGYGSNVDPNSASLAASSPISLSKESNEKRLVRGQDIGSKRDSEIDPVNKDIYLDSVKERRAQITVEPAKMHMLNKSLQFSSTVEVPATGSGVVTSLVHGVVSRVMVDLGERVKAGQVVAYITAPELSEAQSNYLATSAKVKEVRAETILIESRVRLAKLEVTRRQQLNKEGISSIKDVQAAESALASTEAELAAAKSAESAARSYQAAARARLRGLGVDKDPTEDSMISTELALRSPISGVITQRSAQPGQTVGPNSFRDINQDVHLFTISDTNKVWVMLEVPQAEISALAVGSLVEFTSEVAPGKVFRGSVVRMGENFDQASRTVGVRTEIPNPNGLLKPGMLVLAQVKETGGARTVMSVPNSAIQQVKNDNVVFVKVASNRYHMQPVTVGAKDANYAEVLKGIKQGDQIVTKGSFALKSEAVKSTIGGEY